MLMPPPSAITLSLPTHAFDSGLVVVTPPVIVTPLMLTVGSVGARKAPMVTTGPPPRIVVEFGPAPVIWRLRSITIPPANVPDPMRIVVRSPAALIAAWIVEKQPGLLPTHRLAVPRPELAVAAVAPTAVTVSSNASIGLF